MTRQELELALGEFQAGLETELVLLQQLKDLAQRQRDASDARDYDAFHVVSDRRDQLTTRLLEVEAALAPTRARLQAEDRDAFDVPGYDRVQTLKRASEDLVSETLACDRAAMKVLADAEMARRAALASLAQGETTLAAYRRVLAPSDANSLMVDQRG